MALKPKFRRELMGKFWPNCTKQTNAPLGEGGNAITSMGNFTSDDAKDASYCQGYGEKYRASALVMTLPPCDISLLCCCV